MRRTRRPPAVVTGVREAQAIAANLGRDARTTRRRRHLTQAALGELVDLSQSEVSYLERGHGARSSIETWVAIGIALKRPIAVGFSRDVVEPLQDAGHLEAQELVLRLAAGGGWHGRFEVRPATDQVGLSTDLLLERSDAVVLVEIWNRLDDLGGAVRSTDRKLANAPRDARSVWLLVDTAANRAIVRRYPTVIRSRFPGSSGRWVAALTDGRESVPEQAGIAWADLRARRLRPLRIPAG